MAVDNLQREIRIAVVMYGGTSLAIYMNGISQEFLQLVRATSPRATPGAATTGTARVYRKLAHVLAGTPLDEIDDAVLESAPPVRFVIDILSGTSAGGINSVMLAKALARNASLEPLKELWIHEGALDRLINDRASGSARYPYREPVKALFNSDRMYVELLKAMEKLNGADGAGPLVDDLELAITGTDLTGEPIDIRLADGVAQEYNHKHVFEFRLANGGHTADEFTAEHDPLLAFAARTTSSLPAVFEPAVVREAQALAGRRHGHGTPWGLLFRSLREEERELHERHAFADGGYLDNKPFGHAIDRLARAAAGVRVTRKLYYLEPQPQQIDPDASMKGIPSASENTLQVFSLARYETIRADIERLAERNRLLDRVRTLGSGVLEDLPGTRPEVRGNLSGQTTRHGPTYGGYHRLRVATVTDSLATTVADHARVAPESDIRRAIRLVVRAWRNAHFRRDATREHEPESAFLNRFDLQYSRRQASFLLSKINELFKLDDAVVSELEMVAGAHPNLTHLIGSYRQGARIETEAAWSELHSLFRDAKRAARRAVFALDTREPALVDEVAGALSELGELLEEGRLLRGELLTILHGRTEADRDLEAERFLGKNRELVERLASVLQRHNAARVAIANEALADLNNIAVPAGLASELKSVLRTYWDNFIHFDMVQFPLLEATGVGEELSPVEIHRISALDCRHFGTAFADGKLHGTKFASFGAFLDRRWREHDIRWGRLDGAERLITTLLNDEFQGARERLVTEAHLAILNEEFPADREEVAKLIAYRDDGQRGRQMDEATTKLNTARFLEAKAEGQELDPRASARMLSRLVKAGGRLSDTLTTASPMPSAMRNLLGFASLAGSGLIDAGIPKSFLHLLASYWANLLLLFGTVLMVLANPIRPVMELGGAFGLGVTLTLGALAFLLARSLIWSALSPPELTFRAPGVRASRRFGGAALLLALLLVGANVGLETTGAEWRARRNLGKDFLSAAFAMEYARTGGEVACILGQQEEAERCEAPAGAPAGSGTERVRALTHLDFGFIALYTGILAATGVLAIRLGWQWSGVAGILLAVATAALDVWENARILTTLSIDYSAMSGDWLLGTAQVADAKFLAAFLAVAVLLPVLATRGRSFPLNVRTLNLALVAAGAGAVALGLVGVSFDLHRALALAVALLLFVLVGLAFLFALGYFAPGPAGGPEAAEGKPAAVKGRRGESRRGLSRQ